MLGGKHTRVVWEGDCKAQLRVLSVETFSKMVVDPEVRALCTLLLPCGVFLFLFLFGRGGGGGSLATPGIAQGLLLAP